MGPSFSSAFLRWYTLWGASLAWLGHFLLAYGVGEFNCVSGFLSELRAGISGIAWLLIAITIFFFAIAALSCALASKGLQKARGENEIFYYKRGFLLGVSFSFIILFESVPIFFFLRSCG